MRCPACQRDSVRIDWGYERTFCRVCGTKLRLVGSRRAYGVAVVVGLLAEAALVVMLRLFGLSWGDAVGAWFMVVGFPALGVGWLCFRWLVRFEPEPSSR